MPWFRRAPRGRSMPMMPPVCFVPAPSPQAAIQQHLQHYVGFVGHLQHVHELGTWRGGTLLVYAGAPHDPADALRTLFGYAFLVPRPGGWSIKGFSMQRRLPTVLAYQWTRLRGPWLGLPRAVLVYGVVQAPPPLTIEITLRGGQHLRFVPPAPVFAVVLTRARAVRAVHIVRPSDARS